MEYVYKGKLGPLPKSHKGVDGWILGFDRLEQNDPERLIEEGFLPATVVENKEYDPEIQTRSEPDIVEFDDHAEVTYTVTDKPLLGLQDAKKEKAKYEGRQIFKAKWDLEYITMGMYSPEEVAQLEADKETLFAYYKTEIEALIDGAGNALAVKNASNTWPTI